MNSGEGAENGLGALLQPTSRLICEARIRADKNICVGLFHVGQNEVEFMGGKSSNVEIRDYQLLRDR